MRGAVLTLPGSVTSPKGTMLYAVVTATKLIASFFFFFFLLVALRDTVDVVGPCVNQYLF